MKPLSIISIAILLSSCYSGKKIQNWAADAYPISFSEVSVDTSVIACFSDAGHSHQVLDSTVCHLTYSDLQTIEYLLN